MSLLSMSSSADGRINLEQQRKRAKELLRLMRAGSAPGRFAMPPKRAASTTLTLSDAQWCIARELGFNSWPRLKAHVDAVEFAARHPDFDAADEAQTHHWRCGSDIAHSLKLAGFKGRFHMLTDPMCMGPVQDLPYERYRELRGEFISQSFAIAPLDAARRMDDEYTDLAQLGMTGHSVLWCEADAYDQLFLIRALAGITQLEGRLELVEVARIPGVSRFIGIGQLAPDLLAWLWPQRRRIDQEALELARHAWRAYCAPSPVGLAELARHPHAPLPLLAPALRRQLQELPGIEDGLSLTERLALQVIAEQGPTLFAQVFAEFMNSRDPLPALGDMMFHALMRPLIDGASPLLLESDPHLAWPKRTLTLTPLGHQVLTGAAYWPDHASHVRWVGGVCIHPGQAHWTISVEGLLHWRD
jgi:hypothetical protein